jgi:hypothetical protein
MSANSSQAPEHDAPAETQPPPLEQAPTTVLNPENIVLPQRRELEQRLRHILNVINNINPTAQPPVVNHAPTVLTEEARGEDDNTRLVNNNNDGDNNNNANNTTTTAQPPTATNEQQEVRMSRDEMVSLSFRVIPLLLLPALLFIYDHYIGNVY